MKISSLTRSTAVFLSRTLHRSDTSAPRAIGPTQQDAEVGHLVGGRRPRPGPSSDLSEAGLLAALPA